MSIRNIFFIGALAGAAAAAAVLLAGPAMVFAQSAATAEEMGIRVIDRKLVFDSFKKYQDRIAELEREKDEFQDEIDRMEAEYKKMRENLENNGDTMSDEERMQLEENLSAKAIEWKSSFDSRQALMDSKFSKLVKQAKEEIDAVVAQIGQERGYTLILEGDPGTPTGVVYYASAIDITPQVVDRLNVQGN